ncbi:universal stress protein [Cobetia sp. UIB-001]|uniref:universal stress protein n=1 Tax=Cobetia TaxID=204286 RepID=UPI001D5AA67B|nr:MULTISPECIES: universal stress protein [Cobetia]MBR9798909.1 universal stress protein [Gammaproteobacteria bacterium]MDH2295842.1 universal stress protein [Cobetia sp. 1AS1]MDH2421245.1 universal stress protein [Cobetia litoralis]
MSQSSASALTGHDKVTACIDGSAFAVSVCDAAVWASQRLSAPLSFLHVIDRQEGAGETSSDLSGSIGLGAREHLLEELATLDEQRGRIAQEQGRLMLEAAYERAVQAGIAEPRPRQRNGELVETLAELEDEIRLLVIGKRGEGAEQASEHLGSNLERVIRSLHRPVLVVPGEFNQPTRVLIAFDCSTTIKRAVEVLAASPLLQGAELHLVMVGAESVEHQAPLDAARDTLTAAGFSVQASFRAGEVEACLREYAKEHAIDMLVMGAYGHSRIRQLLVGSTTTEMIRNATVPLLILR